ncbi:hypothetical protein FACS189449_08370 [Alphaproteobacteria bacterium]|nr:hypothetical protein FACS189449_08370 [Alphaproteobacteria bacterium]
MKKIVFVCIVQCVFMTNAMIINANSDDHRICSENSPSRKEYIDSLRRNFMTELLPGTFHEYGSHPEDRPSRMNRMDILMMPEKFRCIFARGVAYLNGKMIGSDLSFSICVSLVQQNVGKNWHFLKKPYGLTAMQENDPEYKVEESVSIYDANVHFMNCLNRIQPVKNSPSLEHAMCTLVKDAVSSYWYGYWRDFMKTRDYEEDESLENQSALGENNIHNVYRPYWYKYWKSRYHRNGRF